MENSIFNTSFDINTPIVVQYIRITILSDALFILNSSIRFFNKLVASQSMEKGDSKKNLNFSVKMFSVYCHELGTKNQRPKKEEEGGGGNRWIEKVKGGNWKISRNI